MLLTVESKELLLWVACHALSLSRAAGTTVIHLFLDPVVVIVQPSLTRPVEETEGASQKSVW